MWKQSVIHTKHLLSYKIIIRLLVFTSTVNVVYHGQPIYNGRESLLPIPPLSAHTDHYSRTKQIAEEMTLTMSGRNVADHKDMYTCSLR